MTVRCGVELDIFSGMPNPSWVLTEPELDSFLERLAALPRRAAGELAGNLGYRGFIVQLTQGNEVEVVSVQRGLVQRSRGAVSVYAHDENRELERWLVSTGRPHIENSLFQAVERDFR
ncbi:hypothetical protein PQR46_43360 [Paraburkholderia sediminicola]|uniref:hypothetical protein n=1 Tax=Paraburkholderia TaxID=1822464 RepID=UPI0038BAD1DE